MVGYWVSGSFTLSFIQRSFKKARSYGTADTPEGFLLIYVRMNASAMIDLSPNTLPGGWVFLKQVIMTGARQASRGLYLVHTKPR